MYNFIKRKKVLEILSTKKTRSYPQFVPHALCTRNGIFWQAYRNPYGLQICLSIYQNLTKTARGMSISTLDLTFLYYHFTTQAELGNKLIELSTLCSIKKKSSFSSSIPPRTELFSLQLSNLRFEF